MNCNGVKLLHQLLLPNGFQIANLVIINLNTTWSKVNKYVSHSPGNLYYIQLSLPFRSYIHILNLQTLVAWRMPVPIKSVT